VKAIFLSFLKGLSLQVEAHRPAFAGSTQGVRAGSCKG